MARSSSSRMISKPSKAICDRVIWIEDGVVRGVGAAKEVIPLYREAIEDKPRVAFAEISDPSRFQPTACARRVLGQRKIRVLPPDQNEGGGKFHDDRKPTDKDEARILTHQRFGGNEDRDMDQRDREHGRRCRRRRAAARRSEAQDKPDGEKRMGQGEKGNAAPLGGFAHPFAVKAREHDPVTAARGKIPGTAIRRHRANCAAAVRLNPACRSASHIHRNAPFELSSHPTESVSIEPLLMINTTPCGVAAELRFGGRDDLLLVLFGGELIDEHARNDIGGTPAAEIEGPRAIVEGVELRRLQHPVIERIANHINHVVHLADMGWRENRGEPITGADRDKGDENSRKT